MASQRFEFANFKGEKLGARLDLPEGEAIGYAIHAHCFTCTKDGHTAARMSRELAHLGIAVLRFDFAGLGSSEGDFAETNLSTNIEDLAAAVEALSLLGHPPALLVGHSWGGAAALAVGARAACVRAVVTMGTSADSAELERMIVRRNPRLAMEPEGTLEIGQRRFRVRRQLFEDAQRYDFPKLAASLGKPLLVMQGLDDEILPVEHALRLFAAASLPKSLVILDGADHLLSRREQNQRASRIIAAWAAPFFEKS